MVQTQIVVSIWHIIAASAHFFLLAWLGLKIQMQNRKITIKEQRNCRLHLSHHITSHHRSRCTFLPVGSTAKKQRQPLVKLQNQLVITTTIQIMTTTSTQIHRKHQTCCLHMSNQITKQRHPLLMLRVKTS